MNAALIVLLVQIAAFNAHVNPALLGAICEVESANNPMAYRHNDGGSPSIGLCQLKYATARARGYDGSPDGLADVYTNAFYAARTLSRHLRRYDGQACKAIGAYNAGKFKMDLDKKPKNWYYIRKVLNAYQHRVQNRSYARPRSGLVENKFCNPGYNWLYN